MEFLFGNIGGKIKGLAVTSAIVSAISAFIGGIVFATLDDDFIVFGILMALLGPIIAWVSSWVLYGFGEIICHLDDINYSTRKASSAQSSHRQAPAPKPQNDLVTDYCPECGTQLRYSKNAKFVSCPKCGCTLEVSR